MVGALGYWSTAWLDKQVVESGPVLASSPSVALNADNTVEVTANGRRRDDHLRQSLWTTLPVSFGVAADAGVRGSRSLALRP